MRSFIDGQHRFAVDGDRADYVLGTLPSAEAGSPHQVVLTLLGDTGNDSAAGASANLLRSFPSVGCLLMVGIAAGVPDPARPERHVRLGDIVLARRGIAEYDSVRDHDDGPELRRTFPRPSPLLERGARLLEANAMTGGRPWEGLLAGKAEVLRGFRRPPRSEDVLYASDGSGGQVPHPAMTLSGHRPGQPKVHSGVIASGDRSLRSARKRDAIASAHDVRAIEMEGKGLGNTGFYEGVEWFAIRGISDYGDRHVTKRWRKYASLAASAYTCALLAQVQPQGRRPGRSADPAGEPRELDVLGARIGRSLRQPVLTLMDKLDGRFLTIAVSAAEAVCVTYATKRIQADNLDAADLAAPGRSYVLPYYLLPGLLAGSPVALACCEIRAAPRRTVAASLSLTNGRTVACDPAGAIAVALLAGCPVLAAASLLEDAGRPFSGDHDESAWHCGPAERHRITRTGAAGTARMAPDLTRVEVTGFRAVTCPDDLAVIVAAAAGDQPSEVSVSPLEAHAIETAMRGSATGSGAYVLLCEVLAAAGVKLLAAVLRGPDGGAGLELSGGATVPARAGDSIALALTAGVPVLCPA